MRRGKRFLHFLTSVLLVVGPVSTSVVGSVKNKSAFHRRSLSSITKEVGHYFSRPKSLKSHFGYGNKKASGDSLTSSSSSYYNSYPLARSYSGGWGGWSSDWSDGDGGGLGWGKPHYHHHDLREFLDAALYTKVVILKTVFLLAGTATAATAAGAIGLATLLAKAWILKSGFGVCGVLRGIPFCPWTVRSYCSPWKRLFFPWGWGLW